MIRNRICKTKQIVTTIKTVSELLYATLVSWDMNCRGAKMKYFDEFKDNILSCMDLLREIEELGKGSTNNLVDLEPALRKTYEKLNLMKTGGKLVSNSKLLHFLFPSLLMPMDRANTFSSSYGNTNESINKYIEIIKFSFEIMNMPENWKDYLDNGWNTTVPKMIDNAIILLMEKSVK